MEKQNSHYLAMGTREVKYRDRFIANRWVIIYSFLLFPFLEIDGLWFLLGSRLHYGIAILNLTMIHVILLAKYRRIYLNKFISYFVLYEIISIGSALAHGSLTGGMLYSVAVIWTVLQLLYFEKKSMVRVLFFIFVSILLLDFVSIFYFQESAIINAATPIQNKFSALTGGRNTLATTLFPMTVLIIYWMNKRSGKRMKSSILILLLCAVTVIQGKSATGTVVILAGLILYFILPVLKFDTKIYLYGYLTGFVLLIVFTNFLTENAAFQWTLERLGRGSDLSLRPIIWKNAFEVIQNNMILGAGRGNPFPVVIGTSVNNTFTEAHNMFIQVLMNEGIAGLFFYIKMITSAIKNMDTKHFYVDRILVMGLFCYLVNGLMESIQSKLIFYILLGTMSLHMKEGDTKQEFARDKKMWSKRI